jgi:hypothetical protein
MIETIDESLFISRFEDYKRVVTSENPNGNFTYKGLRALFQYLESLEDDTGDKIELDVIALCCDYSEYQDLKEYFNNYRHEEFINEKKEEFEDLLKSDSDFNYKEDEFYNWLSEQYGEEVEEEINNNTTLIKFEDDLNEGFIIQNY